VWLRATERFQDEFVERLAAADPEGAGLSAVRFVPQWVRDHPQEARLLLLHRREDFLDTGWPEPLRKRANALHRQMSAGLRKFCRRLLGRADAAALRIVMFALADAPLAAVRQHVAAGKPPPAIVDELIEATYRSTIALGRARK
jgi:hypothetical protein